MGCPCSGGVSRPNKTKKKEPPPPFPGENGFLLVEYVGHARRARTWLGPFTETAYLFGGDRRLCYVDIRDGIKFLTPRLSGDARPVFRLQRTWNDADSRKEDHERWTATME